jgi:hypothetical protein
VIALNKKVKITLGILGFAAIMVIAVIGAYIIAKDNIMKSMPKPASEGQEILTLEYISVKKSESDTESTATITFYDDKTCFLSGTIAKMYKWEYKTKWSADGGLKINDEEGTTADCLKEAEPLANLLKLKLSYDLDVQYTSLAEGQDIHIAFKGNDVETGKTLMECSFILSAEDAVKLGVSAGD